MKKHNGFKSLILGAVLVVLFAVLNNWTGVYAEDFDEIEPYEIKKFEDIYGFADYATPIVSAEGEIHSYFKIEVKERGILYISNYSDHKCAGMWEGGVTTYYPLGVYLYKSQNMLSTINYTGRWQESLDGSVYVAKYDYVYYLMPGTYYLEVKSLSGTRYSSKMNMVFAGFLASDKILKIDNIEIVDSEKALVTFNDIGAYTDAYIINGDMLDPEWASSTDWKSVYFNNGAENTFEIDGNGVYTLYVKKSVTPHNNNAASSSWRSIPVMTTFTVEKTEVLAKKIKVNKTKLTLKKGDSQTLTVKITPDNVTDTTITWKSSNKKVATVDKNGKVTAKKKGSCVITATTSNGKKAKCKITVKK